MKTDITCIVRKTEPVIVIPTPVAKVLKNKERKKEEGKKKESWGLQALARLE